MKHTIILIGAVLSLAPTAVLPQPGKADAAGGDGLTFIDLQADPYPDRGKIPLHEMLSTALAAKRPVDWIVYSTLSCNAKSNQYCEGSRLIEAPNGWQACKALYSVSSSGTGSSYSVTPQNWYTNDSESPDRFQAFNFHLYAKGSGSSSDRWGAKTTFSNVGIRLIPAQATNADRYEAGCEMPKRD